jgi:hypothetical protein
VARSTDFKVGVLGAVNDKLDPSPPEILRRMDSPEAAVAGVGSPGGAGVMSISDHGAALHGRAESGPGGRFRSASGAQIHLDLDLTKPPPGGRAGDLLATAGGVGSPDQGASLWFCVKGGEPGSPAAWTRLA